MAPKKALVSNTTHAENNIADKTNVDKNTADKTVADKHLIWSSKMDDALIEAFSHELDIGNKVNGFFTTAAYDNITQHLSGQFGFKVDKDKVKNRWKTLKKNFSDIYDIFKGGMSGFSWNSSTSKWEAEDQVWDQLIEVKPKAANWKNTSIPNYEKMVALYGIDRANGNDGDTPSNMKKRRHEFVDVENEESFENFSLNMETTPLDDYSTSESSKAKRGFGSKDKDPFQVHLIAEKMDVIADVLSEGNKVFKERYTPHISGEETLKMIQECGCEKEKIPKIYNFLMNDVSKLRAVLQCPPLLRKQVIMDAVFGS